MRRVFVLVLDSLGVGALPDADDFGDAGCHTLDHLVQSAGGLDVPHLIAAGLGHVPGVSSVSKVAPPDLPTGAVGRMAERSPGKDTSTGHWEMMGCPLEHAFPVFPAGFPAVFLDEWLARTGLPGWLGNEPASGTEIIERLGAEHLRSGRPIVYTSADSVFQVAAHTDRLDLERLYEVCRVARELLEPMGVARVIARPFVGELGSFRRTYDRRDYSLPPPQETSLERLVAAGLPVIGVGKISDIFAGRGITHAVHTEGNEDGMQHTLALGDSVETGLVFVNLVDFDMLYGHRRDALGYRRALERFDPALGELLTKLREDDLLLLTADHGNDPTCQRGTDHTREYVPLMALGPAVRGGVELGTRDTFADLGATVEEALGLEPQRPGRSFLGEVL
ncbi:MAG: phosphopentomutase [Planctomycetota bacterium]